MMEEDVVKYNLELYYDRDPKAVAAVVGDCLVIAYRDHDTFPKMDVLHKDDLPICELCEFSDLVVLAVTQREFGGCVVSQHHVCRECAKKYDEWAEGKDD